METVKILKTGNENTDRKIRFSSGVKDKFSDVEQKKLAAEFVKNFKKTGRRFIEKHLGAGDVLVCSVTQKLFRIMLECEW